MTVPLFPVYGEWIAANVQDTGYGQCAAVTLMMVAKFPELMRVRGHYLDVVWGPREHWWCVTSDGKIVDPTAAQFPTAGTGHYEPWTDGDEEPIGKCLECGEYCWESQRGTDNFCCQKHEMAYMRYLNTYLKAP